MIFVEVALEREIPGAIAPLLADDRVPTQSDQMTTAVFYSISNCQRGLRGVSFGNFLITQVVQELARDLPRLKNYVTLSPVVGLLHWVRQLGRDGPLQDNERYQRISKLLEHTGWHQNESIAAELQEMLLPTAAAYFLNAKRGDGMPVDAVARFHLGNGARLERINWLGDLSDVGLNQAGGLMVNYLYKLTDIEKNHEAFVNNRRIAVSNEIRKMAKKWQQEFGFDK